jgi:hypothetical protein
MPAPSGRRRRPLIRSSYCIQAGRAGNPTCNLGTEPVRLMVINLLFRIAAVSASIAMIALDNRISVRTSMRFPSSKEYTLSRCVDARSAAAGIPGRLSPARRRLWCCRNHWRSCSSESVSCRPIVRWSAKDGRYEKDGLRGQMHSSRLAAAAQTPRGRHHPWPRRR